MNAPPADRLPPHSDEAEAAVLGCVLLDQSRSAEILGRASCCLPAGPDCFYNLNRRVVYQTLLGMLRDSQPISLVTLSQRLRDRDLMEKAGGDVEVASLPDKGDAPDNVTTHAQIVAEKYARRTLIQTASEISIQALDESHPVNGQLEHAASALSICASLFPAKQPRAMPLFELETPPENAPDELLKDRYLCIGGSLLVCGPTHAGKSSFDMQMAIAFSLAKPFFGITPSRALKSLIIQAENDPGEMALMRDGVCAGLELSIEQMAIACASVFTYREDELRGPQFFTQVVTPLLEVHHPDLLILDPALSYLSGDTSSQRDVSAFCRSQLNPLLRKFRCATIVIHHTNKPVTGKEKPEWRAGEYAYLGTGSSEWANWARAVLAIQSIGSHSVFDLHAAKRGKHLHWRDEHGQPTYCLRIAHDLDPNRICWRLAEPDEGPEDTPKKGRKPEFSVETIIAVISKPLTATMWCHSCEALGMSSRTFYNLKKQAVEQRLVTYDATIDAWVKSTQLQ